MAAAFAQATANGPAMIETLNPSTWPDGEYERLLASQHLVRTNAGYAEGQRGAVTVAYGGVAARAGLQALKCGGNAIDAALTTAMMQVALTAGAPISYFGILSLVYYEAKTRKVHCMNAEWNTVLGEKDPLSIPGKVNLATEEGLWNRGAPPSGRTALVGGFMKGVEAAHRRFGTLPFASLFEPSIHAAEHGVPVVYQLAKSMQARSQDLDRLAETRATFKKPDGSCYTTGEKLLQPALARTLRAVAAQGSDHMYRGPWAEKLVAAVQADGGAMTLEDLARYEVVWSEPVVGRFDDYELHMAPPPNAGGVGAIQAQLLARAAGLGSQPHWAESGSSLRRAVEIAQMVFLGYLPKSATDAMYPGIDLTPQGAVDPQQARLLWERMQAGVLPFRFAGPQHSDDVVAVDAEGNMAAITHSINAVMWGKTAIVIDGISIADAASFQQAQIAQAGPGARLMSPTETGILFRDGTPSVAFASMGSGLHHRTFQALLNLTLYGKSLREAVDTPDFFGCGANPETGALTVNLPKGRFSPQTLADMGLPYEEFETEGARFGSEGIWVGIRRDPATGLLQAVSHNRNNSAAFAY